MSERDALWEIDATLKKKGYIYIGPKPSCYKGPIAIGHRLTDIEIEIPDLDFVTLPKIRFLDRTALPSKVIAHLEQGLSVCYADRSLLRLDRFQPGASILRVLEEAERTIHKSLSGRSAAEIELEFPYYWKGVGVEVLFAKQEKKKAARLAIPLKDTTSVAILLVASNQNIPPGFAAGRAVMIVNADRNLTPTEELIVPQTLDELERWHTFQSLSIKDTFASVLLHLAKQDIVFYSAPNGWVGCKIKLPKDLQALEKKGQLRLDFLKKQLARQKSEIELSRYYGSEASLSHVTSRNLNCGANSLKGKRIAVLGCGAVGSHLARFLVQSGAGNDGKIILADNQLLSAGNIGRHLLNFNDIGKAKADALATELRRFHPEVEITPLVANATEIWPSVSHFDLIVDATGTETVSDCLNTMALERRKAKGVCNLLHVWLFGNGIAAQSFLNAGDGFACYRCLRPDLNSPWINDPRNDVKDAGHLSPASCGDGPYLAFSVDAPVTAASLGLRASLDFFSGSPRSRLRTQVIDAEKAHKPNDKSPRPHDKCPACRQYYAPSQ